MSRRIGRSGAGPGRSGALPGQRLHSGVAVKRRLVHIVRLLPAAGALGLFILTLRKADLGKAFGLIASIGLALPLLLLPFLVAIALETLGWRIAFRLLGRRLPFVGLLKVRLTAAALAMALPSGTLIREALPGVAQRSRIALERLGLSWLRPWLERHAVKFREADAHLARFFSSPPALLSKPLPCFLGVWLVKSLETALYLTLLGAPLPFRSVMAFETALQLARAMIVPVPGGLGVQDFGYVLCLRALDVRDAATIGAAFVLLKRGKEAFWMAVGFALLPAGSRRLRPAPPTP